MDRRRHALFLAALIYGLFSSPTPDVPGWAEWIVLALLAFAAIPVKFPHEKWSWPFAALLAYGLTVPFLTGALSGNAGGGMLRDAIAFGALSLPLLFASLYPQEHASAQRLLLAAMLGIGLLFSLRYLSSVFTPFGLLRSHDLLYLANSPLVAFAGAWLLLHGCFAEEKPGRALALALLSIIPIAAMIGMMQRATVALLILAWLALFIHTLARRPQRALVVALMLALIGILLWPLPDLIAKSFVDKTVTVGWNARGAEFAALLDAMRDHPLDAVFGAGWGSLLKSPAVGDLWVRFSHALLTSLLWKTGWPGLVLGVTAIATLCAAAAKRLRHDMVTLAALLLPLLPALFLYGSYKSLCFGLLLLGLACLAEGGFGKQIRPDQWTNRRIG